MAKLYFKYGAMGSSKSANLLMADYNYLEKNKKTLIAKTDMDTRDNLDNKRIISSRIGIQKECISLSSLLNIDFELLKDFDAILVDEIQFAKKEEIDKLSDIVDLLDIPVICYGLRADFKNELFEGSKRLLAIADEIEEIKTICWCGKKAICNARYSNRKIIRDGEQVLIGSNDSYISLCRKHFKEGKLFSEEE